MKLYLSSSTTYKDYRMTNCVKHIRYCVLNDGYHALHVSTLSHDTAE